MLPTVKPYVYRLTLTVWLVLLAQLGLFVVTFYDDYWEAIFPAIE